MNYMKNSFLLLLILRTLKFSREKRASWMKLLQNCGIRLSLHGCIRYNRLFVLVYLTLFGKMRGSIEHTDRTARKKDRHALVIVGTVVQSFDF